MAAPATYPKARPNAAPVAPAPRSTRTRLADTSSALSIATMRRLATMRPSATAVPISISIRLWPKVAMAIALSGHVRPGSPYAAAIGAASAASSRHAVAATRIFSLKPSTNRRPASSSRSRRSAMKRAVENEMPKSAATRATLLTLSAIAKIPYSVGPRTRTRTIVSSAVSVAVMSCVSSEKAEFRAIESGPGPAAAPAGGPPPIEAALG